MTSRTVLITGAAKRIGAALARDLHAHDFDVIVHCHYSLKIAQDLVNELNNQRADSALVVEGDLLQFDNYEKIINQAHSFNYRLDVLINNASSFFPTPMGEINEQNWQDLMGVNVQAPLFLSQSAIPYLRQSKGCIINMTDIHASQPMKDHTTYCTAKAGLDMLTRSLAREFAPDVRVNGLALGAVLWPDQGNQKRQEEVMTNTAMKRTAELNEVCAAIRFLIDEAEYSTGQILALDVGRTRYT
ncbi:MAG: pteridine reductase [Gammaproteobacteria bacterium]|nr:pteridine reductase [Gammaproteobacteria bacterium]